MATSDPWGRRTHALATLSNVRLTPVAVLGGDRDRDDRVRAGDHEWPHAEAARRELDLGLAGDSPDGPGGRVREQLVPGASDQHEALVRRAPSRTPGAKPSAVTTAGATEGGPPGKKSRLDLHHAGGS